MAEGERSFLLPCQYFSTDECQQHVNRIIQLKHDQSGQNHEQHVKRWLTWARDRRHVKVVSVEVPDGILPKGLDGTLHDAKVFSRGPDDTIYDKNQDIREMVARGNCFLELDGGDEPWRCVTYALKKFTGGLGDDDDRFIGDGFTWQQYFLQPLEEAQQVVCTRKANGEAAHLSATEIGGQRFICSGSKNVHMLVRSRDDINKYDGDRYKIASEICHTVFDTLDAMGPEKSDRLLDFLCQTQLTGVFEILHPAHQHVENFEHMSTPEMKFIVWTTFNTTTAEQQKELCCMPPHVAIEIAKCLGLCTVDYEIIQIGDVDDRMKQIRQGYGYEGEVLYFLDAELSVIGLLKKKTMWYIICRAIREKLRNAMTKKQKDPSTFSTTATLKKVKARIKEIQQWLNMDDACTDKWQELAERCTRWCIQQQDQGTLCVADIGDQFPVTWKKFLEEYNLTDKFEVNIAEDR